MNMRREAVLWSLTIVIAIMLGLAVVWVAVALAFSRPNLAPLYFSAAPYRQDDYSAEGVNSGRFNPLDPALEQEVIFEDRARSFTPDANHPKPVDEVSQTPVPRKPLPTSTMAHTSRPTSTHTSGPLLTNTPFPVFTNTSIPASTKTSRPARTKTHLPAPTNTSKPVSTSTRVPAPTNTAASPYPTRTRKPHNTPKPRNTPRPDNTPKPRRTPHHHPNIAPQGLELASVAYYPVGRAHPGTAALRSRSWQLL